MKICCTCKEDKDLDSFCKDNSKKDGLAIVCKKCRSKICKKYNNGEKKKEWRLKNKDKEIKNNKEYKLNNKEYLKELKRNYYINNKEEIKTKTKRWRMNNKNKRNIFDKNRRNNDPIYYLKVKMRSIVYKSIKRCLGIKKLKTQCILGCSFEEFKLYIESKFEPWMTWDNHGLYNGEFNCGWDIDHIIPLSSAKNIDDVIKLNYYTNLQPLCSKINREIKGGIINYENMSI